MVIFMTAWCALASGWQFDGVYVSSHKLAFDGLGSAVRKGTELVFTYDSAFRNYANVASSAVVMERFKASQLGHRFSYFLHFVPKGKLPSAKDHQKRPLEKGMVFFEEKGSHLRKLCWVAESDELKDKSTIADGSCLAVVEKKDSTDAKPSWEVRLLNERDPNSALKDSQTVAILEQDHEGFVYALSPTYLLDDLRLAAVLSVLGWSVWEHQGLILHRPNMVKILASVGALTLGGVLAWNGFKAWFEAEARRSSTARDHNDPTDPTDQRAGRDRLAAAAGLPQGYGDARPAGSVEPSVPQEGEGAEVPQSPIDAFFQRSAHRAEQLYPTPGQVPGGSSNASGQARSPQAAQRRLSFSSEASDSSDSSAPGILRRDRVNSGYVTANEFDSGDERDLPLSSSSR
jgi:hypothetical protein